MHRPDPSQWSGNQWHSDVNLEEGNYYLGRDARQSGGDGRPSRHQQWEGSILAFPRSSQVLGFVRPSVSHATSRSFSFCVRARTWVCRLFETARIFSLKFFQNHN